MDTAIATQMWNRAMQNKIRCHYDLVEITELVGVPKSRAMTDETRRQLMEATVAAPAGGATAALLAEMQAQTLLTFMLNVKNSLRLLQQAGVTLRDSREASLLLERATRAVELGVPQ